MFQPGPKTAPPAHLSNPLRQRPVPDVLVKNYRWRSHACPSSHSNRAAPISEPARCSRFYLHKKTSPKGGLQGNQRARFCRPYVSPQKISPVSSMQTDKRRYNKTSDRVALISLRVSWFDFYKIAPGNAAISAAHPMEKAGGSFLDS